MKKYFKNKKRVRIFVSQTAILPLVIKRKDMTTNNTLKFYDGDTLLGEFSIAGSKWKEGQSVEFNDVWYTIDVIYDGKALCTEQ